MTRHLSLTTAEAEMTENPVCCFLTLLLLLARCGNAQKLNKKHINTESGDRLRLL